MKKLNIKILVGIPGSGKSLWSKNYVLENPGVKRINRDDLRGMLDSYKLTDGNEKFLRIARNKLIELCLIFDRNIIIDDTNCISDKLNEFINDIITIADNIGKQIEIEIVDFNIDIKTCLERNRNRERVLEDRVLYFMQRNKNEINYSDMFIDKLTVMKKD